MAVECRESLASATRIIDRTSYRSLLHWLGSDSYFPRRCSLTIATDDLIEIAAKIVSAYVGHNDIRAADVPDLINRVFATLKRLVSEPEAAAAGPLVPAVPIRQSVTPQAIICLEDGKRFKTLKRHLRAAYGLSPEQYRAKWGLPADYPMVAPAYSDTRSSLAKLLRLGGKKARSPRKDKGTTRHASRAI